MRQTIVKEVYETDLSREFMRQTIIKGFMRQTIIKGVYETDNCQGSL